MVLYRKNVLTPTKAHVSTPLPSHFPSCCLASAMMYLCDSSMSGTSHVTVMVSKEQTKSDMFTTVSPGLDSPARHQAFRKYLLNGN